MARRNISHRPNNLNKLKMNIKEVINSVKQNKKIMRVLWILCLVLFVVLFSRYMKYKQAKKYYNLGVKNFREENYEEAERYFGYAINHKHTKRFECKARINKALSITTPITPDSVNAENLDENIERLEEAIDVLIHNDCAHKDDSNGHSRKAQKLKEEIEEYIEYLKEQNKEEEEEKKDDDKPDAGQDDDEEKKKQEEEERRKQEEQQKQLKEQFNQLEQQGLEERTTDLELYKAWGSGDIFYSGKQW